MKVTVLNQHNSVINQFLKELRDTKLQKDSMRFRKNIARISSVMAYEISKTLQFQTEQVTTPLGIAEVNTISDSLVITTILRAGLPMQEGFMEFFDKAECGFISAFRKYTDKEHFTIETEYLAAPDLNGKTVVIADTMLATGNSMVTAYHALLRNGQPKRVILASVLGTKKAIDYVEKEIGDNAELWIAAIDPELNEHSYIVPGLGDAGDLAFGDKL